MRKRLTKLNKETEQYEYIEPAKTQGEFAAQRKAVIQRLGEFEDRAKWISVEDRLPDKDYYDFVLAWDSYQECVVIAHYSHRYKRWEDERTLKQYPNKITHWQHFPLPPKTKGKCDEQR